MSLVAGMQGDRQAAFCCGTAMGVGVAREIVRITSAVPREWSVVSSQSSKLKSSMEAFCCLMSV